jgi:hypothetical protein
MQAGYGIGAFHLWLPWASVSPPIHTVEMGIHVKVILAFLLGLFVANFLAQLVIMRGIDPHYKDLNAEKKYTEYDTIQDMYR